MCVGITYHPSHFSKDNRGRASRTTFQVGKATADFVQIDWGHYDTQNAVHLILASMSLRAEGVAIPVGGGIPGDCFVAKLLAMTKGCMTGNLFIETNGEVRPCSFAPMTLDNVNEKPLSEIWHELLSSPFLHQLKDLKTRTGHCQSCPYLEECKGCRARTFVLTGDWFASDPVCPLSLKLAVKEEVK